MKNLMCAIVLALVFIAPSVRGQDVLVPFDSSGKIERIDQKLEQDIRLFPEYPGFREAVLYRTSDTTFVLEIMYRNNGRIVRTQRPLTAVEAEKLRRTVMQTVLVCAPTVILDQSGRKPLIVRNLTLALLYHGWALPAALEVSGAAAGGMYLITGAAGYFVPMLLTEQKSISRGTATLAMYGASRGIGHGLMLGLVVQDDDVTNGILGLGVAASVIEEIVAVQVAAKTNMSDGDAVAIGVMGDFGSAIGVELAYVSDFFEGEHTREVGSVILAGSAVGITTGALLASKLNYTRGDAYIVRGAGVLGVMIPIAALDYGNPDAKAYSYAAMTGSVAGLFAGHLLIRGRDFSTDNGALVTLGEVAGGLLGLGLVTMASPEGENSGAIYWTGATVGAAGGFALTYSLLHKDAPRESSNIELGLDFRPAPDSYTPEPLGLIKPPAVPMAGLSVHFK
jgi:hypothetical protein